MLYFILVWTALLISCLIIGCGVLHGLRANAVVLRSYRIILAAWLGISVLSILLLAVALFTMLSPLTGAVTVGAMMLCVLWLPAVRAELADWWSCLSARVLLVYGASALIVGVFMTPQVTWLDTGLYHYGLIHWFARYGVTPGLALLNEQFGFISAWFALSAPFNPPAFAGRASAVMNGFVLLLLLLQMAIALVETTTRKRLQSTFLLVFSAVVFFLVTQTPFLKTITISASPDIAIAFFTVVAAWAMLVANVPDEQPPAQYKMPVLFGVEAVPLLLAIAAVSIKLTAIPLLAIAVGFYLFKSLTWHQLFQRVFIGGTCSFVLLLPLLSAQSLSSGCPLYPSTQGCLNLPWTLPTNNVKSLAAATHGWGEWFGEPPAGADRAMWLIQQWLGSNHSSKLMALLIVLSALSGIYLLSQKVLTRQRNSILRYSIFWFVVLGWVGTAFMMLKAPMFRFGMGYALLLPVFTTILLFEQSRLKRLLKFLPKSLKTTDFSLIAIGMLLTIVLGKNSYMTLSERLIAPPPLPEVAVKLQTHNGITYAIAQNKQGQCWSAQLPCVPGTVALPQSVELRAPKEGIKRGFRNIKKI